VEKGTERTSSKPPVCRLISTWEMALEDPVRMVNTAVNDRGCSMELVSATEKSGPDGGGGEIWTRTFCNDTDLPKKPTTLSAPNL